MAYQLVYNSFCWITEVLIKLKLLFCFKVYPHRLVLGRLGPPFGLVSLRKKITISIKKSTKNCPEKNIDIALKKAV